MAKVIAAWYTCVLLSVTVHAQTVKVNAPVKQLEEYAKKAGLPMGNPMLQMILADSLNKRSAMAQAKAYLRQNLPAVPDVGAGKYLQESARQEFFQFIGNSAGKQQLTQLQQGMSTIKDTARIRQYIADKLRGFYALRDETGVNKLLNAGAYSNSLKEASAGAFAENTPGMPMLGASVTIGDQLMIKNIPVNVRYSNISGQSTWNNPFADQSLVKFSFDKDAYVKRLNSIVEKKYDLKKYFLKDIDIKSAVKSFTNSRLEALQQKLTELGEKQSAAFGQLLNSDHIIQLDSLQLRNELLNNRALGITAEDLEPVVAALQDSILLAHPVADSSLNGLLEHFRTASAARKYMAGVFALKKEVGEGLQAKSIISDERVAGGKINGQLEEESNKIRNIKELLPLSGLQRLLLSAKQLDIGNIAASGSKGGVQDLFMSGIQTSFLNNNKFLMLGAGKRIDGGTIKDLAFNSSLDPGAYSMQFLQMGAGDITQPHSHAGVVNANTKSDSRRQYTTLNLPRNTFVGAFSEDISLGSYGRIAAQLSKSNNQFKNSAVGNDPMLASKAAALSLFNDFWETLSVGLDYNGQVSEWNMNQRAYVSYSGLGYNNPASPGAGRGTIRYGLKLKRNWYKNKLVLGVRSDFQDISSSALTSSKWKNRQFAIDGRWKLNKKIAFDARFNQSAMKSTGEKAASFQYMTRQLSLASQVQGKMAALPYNSNIMLGYQQIDILPQHSTLLNININHNLVISSHVLSLNLFYNKDIKGEAVYANLLTVETGWTYQVWKKISCSSGMTYLDNKAVVQQLGFRQTAGTSVLPRLNVNMYVDCRKNLLNTPQNYLFGNFRSELAISYQLN
ncbi:hypothetical protein SAMN05660461_0226 [Chitinophaga ginsengisegetis]|uniref:Uncharacterized protein n=1 Tax=Chitinophaga ginsengisegetis TaxID=393003 RepID=A0A1T5N424_9BACT|nr:hypothetical protein [Chitinophaga ginsengisegetis]SKC95094.1 hypothetical protein SAMN05660461_0226 [Chitinophaga ginsengisegetis]